MPGSVGVLDASRLSAGADNNEPAVVQAHPAQPQPQQDARVPTDFSQWSEAEIKAFLDLRGEDYDDCIDIYALMARAAECEHNTGPAVKPGAQLGPQGDDEDDPLEAFMADNAVTAATAPPPRHQAAACDTEDHMDAYVAAHAARRHASSGAVRASAAYADSDEEVYATAQAIDDAKGPQEPQRKDADPLPAVDHSTITYAQFTRSFYDESPELFVMDDDEVAAARSQLQVRVSGRDAPKPLADFDQAGLPKPLREAVAAAGYKEPTAIQAQVLPAALLGRDVLGLAKTGSGKTAAFMLPLVVHVAAQARVRAGQGPCALILAPTRELAEQIHVEARRFGKPFRLRCCAAFGGLQKHAQVRELQAGVEVAVATPGRLIDLVASGACNFERVTLVVVDEVDRCFDLGFEAQVFSIMRHTRPDRQTLLFSATLPPKVRHLTSEALRDAVQVTVGAAGAANADVRQSVLLMANGEQKMQWLQARLREFVDQGEVLVFVNKRTTVEAIAGLIKAAGFRAEGMHGDLDQHSRMAMLAAFKGGKLHVLVATDVAARGLDIRTIRTVVNYDAARNIDTHVHRIGRTGRAGDKDGVAVTLLLPSESRMAAALVENIRAAGQDVPQNIINIAMKDARFKAANGRPRERAAGGGAGIGFAPASTPLHPQAPAAQAPAAYAAASAFATTTAAPVDRPQQPLATQPAATPLPPPPPRPAAHAPDAVAQARSTPASSTAEAAEAPAKRRRFDVAPDAAPAPPVATPAAPQVLPPKQAQADAPKGFVLSHAVGGRDEAPSIVQPSRPMHGRSEAPAPWMQKRIQERMQQGPRRPTAVGVPTPAATQAAPSEALTADAIARAVATAKEAAARIARSQGGDGGAPPPHAGVQGTPQPHAQYAGGDATGWQGATGTSAPQAAVPAGGGAARLTPEEARRVAQQAAARVAELARGPSHPDDWAWGKQ